MLAFYLAITFLAAQSANGKIIYADLSYKYEENVTYFYWPDQYMKWYPDALNGRDKNGMWYAGFAFFMGEHGGTHIDAPYHFSETGWSVDEIPLNHLVNLPLVLVDVQEKVKSDSDYTYKQEDFMAWEEKHGKIPEGAVVFVRSGWSSKYPGRKSYLGSDVSAFGKDRSVWAEERKSYHFPGFDPDACTWLVEERKISGVGTDGPTLDNGQTTSFGAHKNLLSRNVWGAEAVGPLDKVPEKGAIVSVLPMNLKRGSGGPSRIYAMWDTTGSASHPQIGLGLLLMITSMHSMICWY